jgi:hypothetical protein
LDGGYKTLFGRYVGSTNFIRADFLSDKFRIYQYVGAIQILIETDAVFRDPSAWYHLTVVVDTSNATSTDRIIFYVNGVRVTSFSSTTYPSLNLATVYNVSGGASHYIGSLTGSGDFDGYLTEVNFIDGQALTADDFGEYDANGTWKAKRYTGTYGTNGFYLPMKPTTQAELQNTVLYAGNTDEQSIAGIGYAPDFVWIKNRTGANNHYLYDTVRGTDRSLSSQSTGTESVGAQQLTSFDTDGFTVPYDVSGYNNYAGRSYVAWTWDAGDNQTSTGISSVQYFGQGVAQSVKGFGFSPDLVWIKSRDIAASSILIDSVRGSGFELSSNTTGAETSNGVTRFKSIDSDGFTLANTTAASLNQQNRNYVAWGWDAGDGDPVSNTTGDINSTVKANDATGFSIVTYSANGSTGTIGHGLSSAPELIIVKKRNAVERWTVYHQSTSNAYIYLNETFAAETTNANLRFGNNSSVVAPTSSVFTVGNSNDVNGSGGTYVAYCFSEVSGVSKFDSYTGTGAGSHAITTGFRPGFVMIKRTDSANSWTMIDATRNPFNIADSILWADLSDAEASGGVTTSVNFTDTGFELNGAGGAINTSGGTYIYMAFKGSYSDYVSPLNDTGTIDSRAKANPDKGFSIVSWTGDGSSSANVGTGLSSSTPLDMAIVKRRDSTSEWQVGHVGNQGSNFAFHLELNSTAASSGSGPYFMGSQSATNGDRLYLASGGLTSGAEYIAYCFHSVAGYSDFDSYTGTGVAGLSVTTGFRPAFVMIKKTSNATNSNWNITDSTRSPTGTANTTALRANTTDTENTIGTVYVKFTDTGFEITGTSTETNEASANYIYMAFADTADARFNFDASGNKNNWLPNNINSNAESETTYDLMKDTPSLVDENAANFATLNPLKNYNNTIADGNLNISATSTSTTTIVLATIGVSSGKWYWEYVQTSSTVSTNLCLSGLARDNVTMTATQSYVGLDSNGWGYYGTGQTYHNAAAASYGASYGNNDVIGVAFDADAGTLVFYKNGVSQGTAFTGLTSGPYFPAFGDGGSTTNMALSANFGQRPFAYTPPTGFLKLNTFNLPDSTIEDGSTQMGILTYTGTNGDRLIATGEAGIDGEVNFTPDLVWNKSRNTAGNGAIWDSVRGGTNAMRTYGNQPEYNSEGGDIDSFVAGGTNFGTGTINASWGNASGSTYVSWQWKGNGSGVSNTDGSITSTVSANTTSKFSIVSYTGNQTNSTVGHGLGVAPSVVIVKCRSAAIDWNVYHVGQNANPASGALTLNSTAAFVSDNTYWNGPTGTFNSTVFSVGSGAANNSNTNTYIAYCFAEVEGYSAFGSYTGNGSTDGPFVYTGFSPAFIITKNTSGTGGWHITDTARFAFNSSSQMGFLDADTSATEYNVRIYNSFSNGFQIRDNGSVVNTNGGTYIYMAFAENPFKNANAR